MNKKSLIALVLIFSMLINTFSAYGNEDVEYIKAKATVLKVTTEQQGEVMIQHVEARILEGIYEGNTVDFSHKLIKGSPYNIALEKNMKIYVQLAMNNGKLENISFRDISREGYITILFALFFILIILFGGFTGLRSFIALGITAFCILKIFMPMIIKGYGFIITTILVCSIIIIVSFILISGFSKKSFTAIAGTIGGTILSGVLALYFGNLIQLTGISDDTIQMLVTHTELDIDYRGLLYSGITIGVLGAVMDVSMTITSVICEIKKANSKARISTLFLSGLSVGRDIMATMTNTLILAYAGTSLPLLFFFTLSNMPIVDLINSQFLATEILRSLSGSIGLILTIPITSFIAAINS
ncbi:YibE/F family protein [Alkaliphilus hydrothermalis]|uniref:Membrane protein n=1 Tax=Alkaliphilus hydrothermalis TaxID=1482730 RepID=A0ABS2NP58_9FIRM|nr:YibE/F family protein [Alkaliphilus hydrothermalis]MBM7614697.1 putative membrane protein [Alkaliphilus hydrothermalis]